MEAVAELWERLEEAAEGTVEMVILVVTTTTEELLSEPVQAKQGSARELGN